VYGSGWEAADLIEEEFAMLAALLSIVCSYLAGSIPTGYIAGKMVKNIDIRQAGDGNVGAANVFREVGPLAGLVVMLADIAKGAGTIIIAQQFASPLIVYFSGVAVLAGHIWPIYLGFKGGRGESTAAGVLVVLLPQAMLILAAVSLVPFILTRNTILLGAMLFAPLWLVAWILGASLPLICYSIGLPCIVGLTDLFTKRHLDKEIRARGKFMN
jgi:acyl phosphate:glycerol-3-phosphate acyltransferase